MKAVFVLGSEVDKEHTQKMVDGLSEWGIESVVHVASAHKVPVKVAELVAALNEEEDVVMVGVAGRSNALSGVLAANSVHPVFACPPFKDKADMMVNINSSLMMPSETPVMTVIDPSNTVLSIVKIFALKDSALREKVVARISDVKSKF
ncbi:AIR carboxylase family protein [Candidatus Gracilibacteria bacterium]|nr:AIR carboxylase family protein [Candidatus Gracilibacteria bacterium]